MLGPVQEGVEQLWDGLVRRTLGADLTDRPLLFVESPLFARADREETVKLLFESLGASEVYFASSAVLALYANNMTNGLVVSLGGKAPPPSPAPPSPATAVTTMTPQRRQAT